MATPIQRLVGYDRQIKSENKAKDKKKDTEEIQMSDIDLQSTSHMVIRLCFYEKDNDDDASIELNKQADRVDEIVESGIRTVKQYLESDGLEDEDETQCKATMYIYWSGKSGLYHVSGIASSSSLVPYHFRFSEASQVSSFVQQTAARSNQSPIMYLNIYNYNTLDQDIDCAIENLEKEINTQVNINEMGASLHYDYFEFLDANEYCIGKYTFVDATYREKVDYVHEYDLVHEMNYCLSPYLKLLKDAVA